MVGEMQEVLQSDLNIHREGMLYCYWYTENVENNGIFRKTKVRRMTFGTRPR